LDISCVSKIIKKYLKELFQQFLHQLNILHEYLLSRKFSANQAIVIDLFSQQSSVFSLLDRLIQNTMNCTLHIMFHLPTKLIYVVYQ